MKIKEVTYSRLFQVPGHNYLNERFECTATVDEDEDPQEVWKNIKLAVFAAAHVELNGGK